MIFFNLQFIKQKLLFVIAMQIASISASFIRAQGNDLGVPESTFSAGKRYYLYNNVAGKFLSFGGSYATQTVVSSTGAPIAFVATGAA